MRAPATYVVLRHLLTHPDEGPAATARHCHLHEASVRAVLRRLRDEGTWRKEELLLKLATVVERPPRKRLHFRMPNPDHYLAAVAVPRWISGEYAAAAEGYDLVPERLLVYVHPEDLDAAARTALDGFGKVAPPSEANLTLAIADPWLYLDPTSDFVERGQRLLDYQDSRHLQILRGLPRD